VYSCILSLTAAIDGVGGQRHNSAAIPPGKTRYPMYRGLGGPQGRSGRMRKISPPPGFGPRSFQPVASRYIEYAIPALQRPSYPLCVVRRFSTLLLASSSLTCELSLVYVRISRYYHCFCVILYVFRLPLFLAISFHFFLCTLPSQCYYCAHTLSVYCTLHSILFRCLFFFMSLLAVLVSSTFPVVHLFSVVVLRFFSCSFVTDYSYLCCRV
jgi:hypothetical protein